MIVVLVQPHDEPARLGVLAGNALLVDGQQFLELPARQVTDLLTHGLIRTMNGAYVEYVLPAQAAPM